MANLGAVGNSMGTYTAAKSPIPYTSVLSGVGYGAGANHAIGTSYTSYSSAKSPVPYTSRLAGAGGTKGISSGGGGGVPVRTFGRGGAH